MRIRPYPIQPTLSWWASARAQLLIPEAPDFSKLWAATSISVIGNGISTVSISLLAASLTSNPATVASVVVVSKLPWLLFAIPAGGLADQWDRKCAMWVSDVIRAVLLTLLATAVLLGLASIPLLMVVGFLLACADIVFDSNSVAVVPKMVYHNSDRVRTVNSRLLATQIAGTNFAGPLLGGLLFTASRALPFAVDAASFALSARLLRRMRGNYQMGSSDNGPIALRRALREGVAWLWHQPLLRTITLIAGLFNVASLAQIAILVVFAQQVLGLNAIWFSVLLTVGAAGNLLGALIANRANRVLGGAVALRMALFGTGAAALLMGMASSMLLAYCSVILAGLSTMVWNVLQVSLRQSGTPDHLLGRVSGVHKLVTYGAMPFGAFLGGFLASFAGLRAPFLFGGGLMMALGLFAIVSITETRIAALIGRQAHSAAT
jgi:predicted MFS family arabinose efflux permease